MYQIKNANIFITVMMVPVPMMVEPIQWKSRRFAPHATKHLYIKFVYLFVDFDDGHFFITMGW